jgi:hypothetical protein
LISVIKNQAGIKNYDLLKIHNKSDAIRLSIFTAFKATFEIEGGGGTGGNNTKFLDLSFSKATCETLNIKVDTIATDVSLIKTETGETKTTLDRFAANSTTQLAEIRAEQSRHAEMVEIVLAAEWTAAFGGLEASVEAAQTLIVAEVGAVGVELAGQLEMTSYTKIDLNKNVSYRSGNIHLNYVNRAKSWKI